MIFIFLLLCTQKFRIKSHEKWQYIILHYSIICKMKWIRVYSTWYSTLKSNIDFTHFFFPIKSSSFCSSLFIIRLIFNARFSSLLSSLISNSSPSLLESFLYYFFLSSFCFECNWLWIYNGDLLWDLC